MRQENSKKSGKKSKNRTTKLHLVFDENKRREFLTGFHKRKLQRKKEAKEKFEKDLKEERKRIKTEAKESYKKMIYSHKPIPELENLLNEDHEEEDVNVKVVELSTDEIAKKYHWIGNNKPTTNEENEEQSDGDNPNDIEECPGMELKPKKKIPIHKKETKAQEFKSKKEVKKVLKKQATKSVKKSKIFQMKNKLEQQKQRKQSMKLKNQRLKLRDKRSKGHNKRFKNKKSDTC